MMEGIKSGRLPRKSCLDRKVNGFVDDIARTLQGAPRTNLHEVASNPSKATPTQRRELRDGVQRRHLVEDMMELKGTYFPGLAVIKQANDTPETYASIKDRIGEVQKRHAEEVRTLYQWQAQDYYGEMLDARQSFVDEAELGPDIETFYRDGRMAHELMTSFDDELSRHRHAHLSALMPLIRQREAFREQEEAAQRRRDAQFPATVEEYHNIRSKDVKLRVAKFLASDIATKDRLMTEFNWASRQTKPLEDEFIRNEPFNKEVQALVRELEAQDPRLRGR